MTDGQAAVRAKWKMPWLIAFGLGALVIVLATVLIAQRRSIARSIIDSQLRALGLEEVRHEVERLGLNEFGVRNLQIGRDDGLSVGEIQARYSLESLMAGRLAELSVSGVRLRGKLDERGVTFSALDPLWQRRGDAETGAARVVALPAQHIAVDDVVVEIETPQGPFVTTLAADLSEGIGSDLSARASVEAEHALFSGVARLDARGTPDSFDGNIDFELKAGGEILPGTQLEPTAVAGKARFAYSQESFEATLAPTPFTLEFLGQSGPMRVEGETPELSLVLPQSPAGEASAIRVEAVRGRIGFPDLGFEASGLSADVEFAPSTGLSTGSFRIGSLSDTQAILRLCELAVAGTLDATGAQQGFDIAASNSGRELVVDIRGSHDPQTGEGSARVTMQPIEFQPGGLEPAALSPLLVDEILEASGGIDLRGAIHWDAEGGLQAGFEVGLRDLSISSTQGSFEHLNAAIRIVGPWPPSTPPHQLVSMARMDFGLELTNGLISFQLRPDGVLDIESAEWALAGGTIRTQAELDPRADMQELVLEVADLDLAELLKLVDLAGLSGSGRLSGSIPVRRRDPTLQIHGAVISSTSEGGWIRYRPDADALGAQQQQDTNIVSAALGTVLSAVLENLHYETLEVTLDGDTASPVNVSIHVAGANPDYLDGHPVEFNLGIESRLADILKNATAVYQIPAEIERRLRELSEKTP